MNKKGLTFGVVIIVLVIALAAGTGVYHMPSNRLQRQLDLGNRYLEEQNYEEAFRAAHTLKGICQNLAFVQLYDSSAQLCEALRGGAHPEAPALSRQAASDYQQTISAIRSFQSSLPQ